VLWAFLRRFIFVEPITLGVFASLRMTSSALALGEKAALVSLRSNCFRS
jgi:hypothetical protein